MLLLVTMVKNVFALKVDYLFFEIESCKMFYEHATKMSNVNHECAWVTSTKCAIAMILISIYLTCFVVVYNCTNDDKNTLSNSK